jgi:signal transduction histidine kinase
MMAMLAHELRGPLAPILSGLQLLRSRGESAVVCNVIERQVRHLAHLVDDMLDIAQISRGKVSLRSRALDLREVVGNAIEMASPLLEQKHHRLVLRMPAGRLILDGDEMRLSQVVANLLTNAAKYTEPGGEITLGTACDEEWAVLSVRDNGQGLSPELMPHLFQMFTRGSSDASGGLGLGLAIVKSLVELHGGSVEAMSDGPGRGSEFVVRLPLVTGPDSSTR